MVMASVKIVLYKSKTYKDGTHPLVLQVISDRKVKKISLNQNIRPKDWNDKANLPRKGSTNYDKITSLIRKKLAEAENIRLVMQLEQQQFSFEEFENNFLGNKQRVSFTEYTKSMIDRLNKSKRLGNAYSYQNALNNITRYSKKQNIQFSEITHSYLSHYQDYHLGKGNSINGFNVYMRAIRAIFNKAIHEGIIPKTCYPFENFSLQNKKTIKRAISKDDILKIINLEVPEATDLWHARNLFVFSFETIGMSWIDIANLKVKNIVDGRIFYTRAKTKKEYSIKITKRTEEVLNLYISGKQGEDYIFPIIHRSNIMEIAKDVRNALKLHNQRLKVLAKMAGIEENLTSYVARHSWASIANFSGVHIGVIAQGLGHNDIKTTQTYLADFSNNEIDLANQSLL